MLRFRSRPTRMLCPLPCTLATLGQNVRSALPTGHPTSTAMIRTHFNTLKCTLFPDRTSIKTLTRMTQDPKRTKQSPPTQKSSHSRTELAPGLSPKTTSMDRQPDASVGTENRVSPQTDKLNFEIARLNREVSSKPWPARHELNSVQARWYGDQDFLHFDLQSSKGENRASPSCNLVMLPH